MKSQTHVEYLLIIGIGIVLALIAALGIFLMSRAVEGSIKDAYKIKDDIVRGLQ